MPNFLATVRTDNNVFLGITSERYEITQNYEFFSALLADKENVTYSQGGVFGDGARAFIMLKGVDKVIMGKKYKFSTIIKNSFDGSWKLSSEVIVESSGLPISGLELNTNKRHTKNGLIRFIGEQELTEYVDVLQNIIKTASAKEFTVAEAKAVAGQVLKRGFEVGNLEACIERNFDGTAWGILLGANEYIQTKEDISGEKVLANATSNPLVESIKKAIGLKL